MRKPTIDYTKRRPTARNRIELCPCGRYGRGLKMTDDIRHVVHTSEAINFVELPLDYCQYRVSTNELLVSERIGGTS